MPSSKLVIAIDGPAGAGKSTVARSLSESLGLKLLDTGSMYRALAFKSIESSIPADKETEIVELARQCLISFDEVNPQNVMLDGTDVSDSIRSIEIGEIASQISVYPEVRQRLVHLQQEVIQRGGYVLEGRDVTTVVAPLADLKIFLTASIEERARRRWLELRAVQPENTLQNVVKDVIIRDHRDYTRSDGALMLAEDAVIIESFGLSIAQVVDTIKNLVSKLD